MAAGDEWDACGDEWGFDPDRGRVREARPSRASVRREWRRAAAEELEDLGSLYGVSPQVVKGGL